MDMELSELAILYVDVLALGEEKKIQKERNTYKNGRH